MELKLVWGTTTFDLSHCCVVVLWPQSLYLSRMKNQRGHWVCWMSTSRKDSLMWRTHTPCRGLKNPLVDPGMITYYPPYNFPARNLHVIYTGTRTETENTKIPTTFLRNGTSRKKGTNWWCSLRGLKSYSFIYSSEYIEWWKGSKTIREWWNI